MDEVVHGCSLIATQNNVDCGEDRHNHHAILVGNLEAHLEETRDTTIYTSGIGNQEDEGDDRSCHTQALTLETGAKEIGHRATLNMLRHQFGAASQDNPGQQRTNHGITNTNPCGRKTVFPPKLSCIANKDDRREITGAIGESREPGTYGASAKHESINTTGLLAGVKTHSNHHSQENNR